jgi:hypothetical protein
MESRNILIVWSLILSLSVIVLADTPDNLTESCPSWAYLDSLGGLTKSEPVIHSWNGSFIVAVQGTDDGVYVKEWDMQNLTGWYLLNGGWTSGRPRLAVENGSLYIYVMGKDDAFVYRSKYESLGRWSSWENLRISNSNFGDSGPAVSGGVKAYQVTSNNSVKIGRCTTPYSPEWTKDLIIYEISTKEFTSPYGPETGNFNSLKEKIPYLAELGITGVWVSGHSWSDPHHFNNIWTQYACIRPDILDPTLGSPQDFKDMITEAHKYDIKIFLDVIDHGVMNYSSLIQEHPTWFRPDENPWRWIQADHKCPWLMTDYDWEGDQPELERWWIDTWTNYVTEYGVDGYRIDLGSMREDLWARIKDNCRNAGHDIAVFEEGLSSVNDYGRLHGVYDFLQFGGTTPISDPELYGNQYNGVIRGANALDCIKNRCYFVEIKYADGSLDYVQTTENVTELRSISDGRLRAAYRGKTSDKIGTFNLTADGTLDHEIILSGVNGSKTISGIVVKDFSMFGSAGGIWDSQGNDHWLNRYENLDDGLHLYFSPYASSDDLLQEWNSKFKFQTVEMSSVNFLLYSVRGSRFKFGYSAMFTPFIPLFHSGEEFNNTYIEVPNKVGHYGWWHCDNCPCLTSAEMQWNDLNKSDNKAFFDDAKKIISIRKNETALNYFAPSLSEANVLVIDDFTTNIRSPKPYMRWYGDEAVIVVGNSDKEKNLSITMNLTVYLNTAGIGGQDKYQLTDLWTGDKWNASVTEMQNLSLTVASDNFRIIKIMPETTQTTSTTSTTSSSTSTTTITTLPIQCTLRGNYPPCDKVTLQEIVDAINAWAVDEFALTDVIDLINAWAAA